MDSVKVKNIIIYPIKGMKGCEMRSVKTLERGFENDRRYMLIDENIKFISQRTHPMIAKMIPRITEGNMIVTYLGKKLEFSLNMHADERVKVSLFEHTLDATVIDDSINAWFSSALEEPVQLVKMTNADIRLKELKNEIAQTEVSFADGYPYLIAGTKSLDQLNEKLDEQVLMDRFRPNIVVETTVPHVEDSWGEIRIGNSLMHVIKPCARCPVVTVNQKTAVKSKEPLKTLATYRKEGNKVFFGANAICKEGGDICIGDEVICL